MLCIALSLRPELAVVFGLAPGGCPDLIRLSLGLNAQLAAERVLLVEALPNEIVQAAKGKPGGDVLQMPADRRAVVAMKRPRKFTDDQVAERNLRVGELSFDRPPARAAVGRGLLRFRLSGARWRLVPRRV